MHKIRIQIIRPFTFCLLLEEQMVGMAAENRLNHQAFFCSAMSLRSIAFTINKPLSFRIKFSPLCRGGRI